MLTTADSKMKYLVKHSKCTHVREGPLPHQLAAFLCEPFIPADLIDIRRCSSSLSEELDPAPASPVGVIVGLLLLLSLDGWGKKGVLVFVRGWLL